MNITCGYCNQSSDISLDSIKKALFKDGYVVSTPGSKREIRNFEKEKEEFISQITKLNAKIASLEQENQSIKQNLDNLKNPISKPFLPPIPSRETILLFMDKFLEPYPRFELPSKDVYKKYREWCDKTYGPEIGPKNVTAWGVATGGKENSIFEKKKYPSGMRILNYRFKV